MVIDIQESNKLDGRALCKVNDEVGIQGWVKSVYERKKLGAVERDFGRSRLVE